MRLVIQVPCFNEGETIAATLADLPRHVEGCDEVLWLVIDDGSTDDTAAQALAAGADHIVRLTHNRGLATAFEAGVDAALKLGADVLVNTDGDNQYQASGIAALVAPIAQGRADLVVGSRDVVQHPEFSWLKKRLQRIGSWVVRQASGTQVADATSGFRAYSREALLGINVVSRFSYTLETVIQAGKNGLAVTDVGIDVNPTTRPSRLFTSKRQYVRRSAGTIVRVYAMHQPLRFFAIPAALAALGALALFGRFTYYLITAGGAGHIQSLIIAGVLALIAVQAFMLGVLAELLRANRVIAERTLRRIKGVELIQASQAASQAASWPQPDPQPPDSQPEAANAEIGGHEHTRLRSP